MITILGPTASGKTALAVYAAGRLNGEVISADSRQVYRGMDIGTGKDLGEYNFEGRAIPFHLIDIIDPGSEYNVYLFTRDFRTAADSVRSRSCLPVLCGGTGLYIQAVHQGYNLMDVPEDKELRGQLSVCSTEELVNRLRSYGPLHATTDITDRNRLLKAIEIKAYFQKNELSVTREPLADGPIFGIQWPAVVLRRRITERLKQRLDAGMLDEVRQLLDRGVSLDRLMAFGLEYKWAAMYLKRQVTFDKMFAGLNTGIHQFAKRQRTWFRRMERMGFPIRWIEGALATENQFQEIYDYLQRRQTDGKH